jgi:hypothetical protein
MPKAKAMRKTLPRRNGTAETTFAVSYLSDLNPRVGEDLELENEVSD